MNRPFKIPESVLVVIHTPALDVLLINRADAPELLAVGDRQQGRAWPRTLAQTAVREVVEETGIDCRPGTPLHAGLRDWGLENVYDIYPRWLHRYAPGVTRNTEHVFGLCVPARHAGHAEPARAHGIPLAALARGGRRLLLAVQRRGDPDAATICRSMTDGRPAGRDLQHPQGRAGAGPGAAAGDPQPRPRGRAARRRHRLPAGSAQAPPARGAVLHPLARAAAGRVPGARGLRGGVPDQRDHPPRRARQRAAVALAGGLARPRGHVGPPLRAARPAARARCTPTAAPST